MILRIDDGCIFTNSLNDYASSCGIISTQLMNHTKKLLVTTTDNRIVLFSL